MVPKGVLFVCFLWIGILSALPSHNDDGFGVPFKRSFQTAQDDAFSDSEDVPRYRNRVQSPHEQQETADPTARMDLVKSIDDILRSPYKGPYLGSLQPLLQRQQTFIRPTRDSSSYRGDSSPTKRITPFSDKVTDTDQFSQSNFQTKYDHNKPPTSAISSHKTPSYSNFELQRVVRTPTRDHERKPFDYSSQTFGSDSQTHFETIHDDFGTSYEPVQSQRRPSKDRHSNLERRPATRQSSSDFQRHPDSTNLFDESFHSSGDQRRQQTTLPISDSQRYSAQDPSYSPSKKQLRNQNIRFSDPFPTSHGYSSFERPFRPSSPHLSRRHMRNRRDLHSSQEPQHHDQGSNGSSGKPKDFPDFASIGGLRELQEGSAVASGNFNHNLVFPKVKIPEIKVQQPMFREDYPFRKQNNEAPSKILKKRDISKTNPTFNERSVKKELSSSQTLDDQLPSQSAQIPLHRIFGRKDANPESFIAHSRVPRQFIHYPVFDRRDPIFDRRDRAESINSPFARENIFLNQRHFQALEEEKLLNQRFFPSFPDGRFFGPAPVPQPAIQQVGSGGHRGRSSNKEFSKQRPFRASTKNSHNTFNDFEPVDNSILGSGNFEVIKGGTFYDNDDPHLNHNPYDPYLDNSYVVFPSGNPPSSNHVDDFFQNFRDFSEFATRRSDSNHFDESPNDGYLASGFSEHIPSIVSLDEDMMTSESKPESLANATANYEIIRTINVKNNGSLSLSDSDNEFSSEIVEKSSFLKPKQLKKYLFKNKKESKSKFAAKKSTQERKRPKNIQDVLEQIEENEQINYSKNDSYDATDPLIAIF